MGRQRAQFRTRVQKENKRTVNQNPAEQHGTFTEVDLQSQSPSTAQVVESQPELEDASIPYKSTTSDSSGNQDTEDALQEETGTTQTIPKFDMELSLYNIKTAQSAESPEAVVNDERYVRFEDSARYDKQTDKDKPSSSPKLQKKRLTRSYGSRISKEAIEEMLSENTDKEITNNTFVTLVIKVFAFFFPTAIKSFVATWIQCLGGLIVLCVLTAGFFYFYWQLGFCDTQLIETSEIPDNMLFCKERYLAQQLMLGLDKNGVWSSEPGYDKLNGGPWQLNFQGFQANDESFGDTINLILNKSQEFIISSYNRPFFEVLEEAFFYKPAVEGLRGAAFIQTNMQLPAIFNNYFIHGFSAMNLQLEMQDNWEQQRIARVGSNWYKLQGTKPCEKFVPENPEYAFEQRLMCRSTADYNSEKTAEHWLEGTQVRTLAYSFYPILMQRLFPGSNFTLSYRSDQDPIALRWDFSIIFGYDYCNSVGQEHCYNLMRKSNSLAANGGPEGYKDEPYFGISDFIEIMNQERTLLPIEQYDQLLAERTVYINSLKQFGFFLGKDYVYRPQNHDHPVESNNIFQKTGKSVEYIIVPQLSLATPSMQETKILGETYFVCESCEDRARYLKYKRNGQKQLKGMCKKSAYIYLHLYAYAFDVNLTEDGIKNINADVSIENNYVTTFLYRLDGSGEDYSFFTSNFRHKDSVYYYNNLLSELDDLHCDASEWAYKDNLNISVPFTLTTGIYTCEVEYCDSLLEKLGDAQANVQLFYLVLLVGIISVFVILVLPQVRSKDKEKRQKFANMLYESITSVADNV